MEPVEAKRDPRIAVFIEEAKILSEEAQGIVPIEASIGGTIYNYFFASRGGKIS